MAHFQDIGNMKPYKEWKEDNFFIRKFTQETNSSELVWHRDLEDRWVESIHSTNWKIQLDNNLPEIINKKIFIKKGVYHRLIKGTGDLIVRIEKLY